jgi:hypothetical protein
MVPISLLSFFCVLSSCEVYLFFQVCFMDIAHMHFCYKDLRSALCGNTLMCNQTW